MTSCRAWPDWAYTAGWYVWGEWFLAGNQGKHQNLDPSLLTNKLWLVFMRMKQKKKIFWKKKSKSKWPTQKKVIFQNELFLSRPFFIFFFQKNIFFCLILMKTSQSLLVSKDGSKFWCLSWFPAKNHSPQTFQPGVYVKNF